MNDKKCALCQIGGNSLSIENAVVLKTIFHKNSEGLSMNYLAW